MCCRGFLLCKPCSVCTHTTYSSHLEMTSSIKGFSPPFLFLFYCVWAGGVMHGNVINFLPFGLWGPKFRRYLAHVVLPDLMPLSMTSLRTADISGTFTSKRVHVWSCTAGARQAHLTWAFPVALEVGAHLLERKIQASRYRCPPAPLSPTRLYPSLPSPLYIKAIHGRPND
jgi:hypothetical protein